MKFISGTKLNPHVSTARRFLSRVDICGPDECWDWTGSITRVGYGKMGLNYKHVATHRLAYELFTGPIPKDRDVCHACDNKKCCNPGHLFIGTAKDNIEDAAIKGRMVHRLEPDDVRRIRRVYIGGGATQKELADEYGVTQTAIHKVTTRQSWKHVA